MFCPFVVVVVVVSGGGGGVSGGEGESNLLHHIGQKWKFSSLITLKASVSRMQTNILGDYIVFVMHTVVHSW